MAAPRWLTDAILCMIIGVSVLMEMFEDPNVLRPSSNWRPDVLWCLTAFVLASPYILYYYIWHNSSSFASACAKMPLSMLGGTPVSVFAKLCPLFKIAQFSMLGAWWAQLHEPSSIDVLIAQAQAHGVGVALGVLVLVVGQVLNFAVYWQLGDAGVYYGFKLGCHIPWVEGFPFNIGLRHPQYAGSILGAWGVAPLLATEAALNEGLVLLMVLITVYYALISWVEESGDQDASSKKK